MTKLRVGTSGLLARHELRVEVAADREAVWALLADTDRLNRELDLPPVEYRYAPRDEGGSHLHGRARLGGQTFEYREEPYCWTRPMHWSVRRVIEGSPLASIRPGVDLRESGDGTEVRVFFEAEARSLLQMPVARTVARAGARGMARVCRGFDAFLRGNAPTPYPRHREQFPAQVERLRAGVERLCELGVHAELAERLGRHLHEAAIEDVTQFRPYALAGMWRVRRDVVLRLCLLAVEAGLLDMRWRVLCPSCRGAGSPSEHLADLSEMAHCPSCNIHWGPDFDESVEVCFSVAPRIRQNTFGSAIFCAGGPMRSPHVVAQWSVAPRGDAHVPVEAAPGPWRLTSPQAVEPCPVELGDAPDLPHTPHVRLTPQGGRVAVVPPQGLPVPPQVVWQWQNDAPFPVLVRLETPGWLTDVATAATVTSLQLFRERFGSEVLSPGVEMAVKQITLLFTDLKDSTRMYAERGDAPSYAAVREHFEFLRRIIDARGGGIVKTIGDALMASFPDAADAVSAALEIQRLAPLQADPLTVKVGLHAGSALAVNANGLLDYFGQVVNEAARIQAQSLGGDVVLAAGLAHDGQIASLLGDVEVERFTAHLRGLSEPVPLLRCRPRLPESPASSEAGS